MTPAISKIAFVVLAVGWYLIRYEYARRSRRAPVVRSARGPRETALLLISLTGLGIAPFTYIATERRAEAVKRILIQEFRLPAGTLIAVGYGKTQLKNTTNSFAAENRRVQIVNTEQRTTARGKAPE
jgi:hypothetical protein